MKIHFIGICGYIMSAMAVMLKQMGNEVSGSDQNAYPPVTDVIDRAQIKRFENHSPANLGNPDLVVIGNHIQEDNIEAKEAIKRKLNVVSLPELIGKIFTDKKRIVIGGTHGKTTTSSLIAWVLESAGLDPSFLVGGILKNNDSGFKLGKGNFFVIEGDEYRTAFFDKSPKFFHYKPDIAVLTTCEFDHPDYFKNLFEVKKTFTKFLELVPKDGLALCGTDDPNVDRIFEKIKKPKISYGLGKTSSYQAFDLRFGDVTNFKVKKSEELFGEFQTKLSGIINVQNALAAIAVADYLGTKVEKIQKAIATFEGAKRRFEIIGKPKGITVIDDYAHHPTKIKKTLAAARTKYKTNKIYCVFEPHTYSRTKALISDYAQAFDGADEVIISELMPAREAGQKPTITSEEVVASIKKYNSNVKFIPKPLQIMDYLIPLAKTGNVVIIMSVGGLDNLASKLTKAIKK